MHLNANNINNYNKFLKKLDETNKKKEKKDLLEKTSCPIDDLLNTIEKEFQENKYHKSFFSGYVDYEKSDKMNSLRLDEYIDFPKTEKKDKVKVNIDFKVNSLEDLLLILEKYPLDISIEYNININVLHNIKEPLIELINIIGMTNLKKNILDQILYYIQDLHLYGTDFMHTVIYGPPGTGKTEIAKIIGKLFMKMGILKSGVFKKVTRSDLVSGYLGQTAIKTKEVIKECLGGVLFIDEAYALGNNEKKDSFSKECIDTLCEALSDYKDNLMVIIAGYENELKECFFSYNRGLDSRFTWRFKTDDYSGEDLKNIFLKMVKDICWKMEGDLENSWFEKKKEYFKFYGRDIEILLSKIKIAHSRRMFGNSNDERKKINLLDMEGGLQLFMENEEVKARKNQYSMALASMYV
jgi:AAA+ superfamily predicted ATPase